MGTDSLYYIRDYSGNYYRINNVNELVAVRNETDATVFMLLHITNLLSFPHFGHLIVSSLIFDIAVSPSINLLITF